MTICAMFTIHVVLVTPNHSHAASNCNSPSVRHYGILNNPVFIPVDIDHISWNVLPPPTFSFNPSEGCNIVAVAVSIACCFA